MSPPVEILGLELLELILEEVESAGALLLGGSQRGDLPVEIDDPGVFPRHDFPQRRLARVGVQRHRVGLRVSQRLGAVLTRDLELAPEELGQRRNRHELPADPRAAAPPGVEGAPNDQLRGAIVRGSLVPLQTAFGQRTFDIVVAVHPEERLDRSLPGPAAQGYPPRPVRPSAAPGHSG